MTTNARVVLGFCPTHADAEEAVDRLRLSGFRNTDVSALVPEELVLLGALHWPAGPCMSHQQAREHEDWLRNGGIVLSVRCSNADWIRRADRVFSVTLATAAAC
jgi:hypothetical protein